jgi:hypothetical protein
MCDTRCSNNFKIVDDCCEPKASQVRISVSGSSPTVDYKNGNYDVIIWTDSSGQLVILNAPEYKQIILNIDNPIVGSVEVNGVPTAPATPPGNISLILTGGPQARIL